MLQYFKFIVQCVLQWLFQHMWILHVSKRLSKVFVVLTVLELMLFLAQQLFQLWQWFCCGWKFLLPSLVFQCGLTHCKAICFSLFWPSSCASQVVQWRDPNAKQQLHHVRTTSSPHLFVPANQQLSSVIYSSRLGSMLPHEQLQQVKQDCGNSMLHFFRLVWNTN